MALKMICSAGRGVTWLAAAAGVVMASSGALAQLNRSAADLLAREPEQTIEAASHRSTLAKMLRPITTEFNENKLEDVVKFLEDFTGATIEVQWATGGAEGLNPEQQVTLKVRNMPALTVLERVLSKASTDLVSGGATWQMTSYGTIEIGPKAILNRAKRVELYDIHDLLIELPRYDQVPQIDLQSLLQQSSGGGGGGGQSPFTNDQDDQEDLDRRSQQEKGEEVMRLITTLVEPEEWVDGGGEGGTIRYYNGNLIVNAPDYMHRQISGYPYWPSHTGRVVGGRRYVSLNMDSSIGALEGFENIPVTGVTGGGDLVPSGPGGSVAPDQRGPGGKAVPGAQQPGKQPNAKQPATKAPAAGTPSKAAPGTKPVNVPSKKTEKK